MKPSWMRCDVCALSLMGAVLLACGSTPAPVAGVPPRPGVTNAQPGGPDAVVEQLARARCDQEQRCGNIGERSLYASRQACLEQMHGALSDDLESFDCTSGLDRTKFDGCATSLEWEACGHPFETLARYHSCRKAASCIK
jgi:hypothetical protein